MLTDHDHLTHMLTRLKLTAIRDQFDSLLDEASRRELTLREAVNLLCEREIARKDERRIEMAMGFARFPFVRDLSSFDFAAQPSIDRAPRNRDGSICRQWRSSSFSWPARRWQDSFGGRHWPRSNQSWVHGLVRFRPSFGRRTCESAC